MMSYWVLFIGIAVVSWLVQMNLQNKFKKYLELILWIIVFCINMDYMLLVLLLV